MSTTTTTRRKHAIGGPDLGRDAGSLAKRQAAAILEVLAGARTPAEAAQALAVTVPRYYQLEARALQGLVAACEPRPKGRVRSADSLAASLRRDNERLQREVSRQQALARAAQRAIGLSAPVPLPAKAGKRTRRRRVARALNVAKRLQEADASAAPPAASNGTATPS